MAPDVADRYLGTMDQLSDILLRNVVDELLIALPTKSCYDSIERAIAIAEQVGVEVVYMQDLYVTTPGNSAALDEPEMFTELVPPQDHHHGDADHQAPVGCDRSAPLGLLFCLRSF